MAILKPNTEPDPELIKSSLRCINILFRDPSEYFPTLSVILTIDCFQFSQPHFNAFLYISSIQPTSQFLKLDPDVHFRITNH